MREIFVHSSVLILSKSKDIKSQERCNFLDFVDCITEQDVKANVTSQSFQNFTSKFKSIEKANDFFDRFTAFFEIIEDKSERSEMESMIFNALKIRDVPNVYLLVKDETQKGMITKMYDKNAYPYLLPITILEIDKFISDNN